MSGARSPGPRRPRRSTSSRTACWRSASQKGDAFGLLGRTNARVGALRLRARARRRRRRADLREQLAARHAVRPRALGVPSARSSRTTSSARRSAGCGVRARDLVRGARRAARARPRLSPREHPTALDERADSIDEDDLFTFIYTSGTTGPPKACMIRHRNYYAMVQKGDEMEDRLTEPGDVMLLYLPLAHNYGRLLHLSRRTSASRSRSCPIRCARRPSCVRVRPTLFPSVPRVYEKIHTAVVAEFDEQTGATQGDRRLGARASAAACRRCGRRSSPCRARWLLAASPRRPARLLEGEGAARRHGCASRTPAARRSRARSPSSSTRSTS